MGLPWCSRGSRLPQIPTCLPAAEDELERTEALLGDAADAVQKLTAEFEEVRVLLQLIVVHQAPWVRWAGLGQLQSTWGLSLVSIWVLMHGAPPTPQAQLAASQLQAELEKLRCTSALGLRRWEEAAS